jgi:hypothetical protein
MECENLVVQTFEQGDIIMSPTHDLRINSNFSESEYRENQLASPSSTNTSVLLKRGALKSPKGLK